MDDRHRIGARHIQPRLDDVGGEQDVAVAAPEAHHRLVDLGSRHLAMRLQQLEFGHQLGQLVRERRHVGDARHNDEALPAARAFAQQGRAQRLGREGGDGGADRLAARRWRRDYRELAQAHQRRLQRAWDRGGRQRQHMARG